MKKAPRHNGPISRTETASQTGGGEIVNCAGINSCKGQGNCAGNENACKAKNSCKGKGWVETTQSDCEAQGGEVLAAM